ncbi:MAG TPA: UvrD-helicase domain-containing protein [Candidatus Megaira endosymbiont of Hartmannula sinica]|nr:UvrD-helicase domain-containing protein [Candidatus Megaera endosymbiont of Hartmannula sinica]
MQKNLDQIKASSPSCSVWVDASAGTGKTKILTDRLLRLMLSGVNISKILCLTFTNIAAGEMQIRIISSLKRWSSLTKNQLIDELENIGYSNNSHTKKLCNNHLDSNSHITDEIIIKAQNLYKDYIRRDFKLNILTIHSFCQKTLKQFSIEANIAARFDIINDINKEQFFLTAKKLLLNSKTYNHLYKYLIKNYHPSIIDEIIKNLISGSIIKNIANDNIKNILENDENYIKNIIDNIDNNSKSDSEYKRIQNDKIIIEYLGSNLTNNQLKNFFLTQAGSKRKKIISSKICKEGSNLHDYFLYLQDKIYQIDQEEKEAYIEKYSLLIKILQIYILELYDNFKIKNSLLDYDDLISKTANLLFKNELKLWVLYKIDEKIDHLLIDEAQDTSKEQWQIVESLIEEFYYNDIGTNRTLFVVGDAKQSIFSFQGADIRSFALMRERFAKNISSNKNNKFRHINLSVSYRSNKNILTFVYKLFSYIKANYLGLFDLNIIDLSSYKELLAKNSCDMQKINKDKVNNSDICHINNDVMMMKISESQQDLADKISNYIKSEIDNNNALAKDFMILFQRRNNLTLMVIDALNKNKILTSGSDRIKLQDSAVIIDIIMVVKFIFNNHDNLNLVALLKSPIFGFVEKEIQEICLYAQYININSIFLVIKKVGYYEQKNNSSVVNHKDTSFTYFSSRLLIEKITAAYKRLEQIISLYKDNSNYILFFHKLFFNIGYMYLYKKIYGNNIADIINEFISLAKEVKDTENLTLFKFINWFEENDRDIKKDIETVNSVKIMTVHASKGLQSKYVIIADANLIPVKEKNGILHSNNNLIAYKNSSYITDKLVTIRNDYYQNQLKEYYRLLYVAITRAEEKLVIAGFSSSVSQKVDKICWYNIICQTFHKTIESTDYIEDSNHDNPKATSQNNSDTQIISNNSSKNQNYLTNKIINIDNLSFINTFLIKRGNLNEQTKVDNLYAKKEKNNSISSESNEVANSSLRLGSLVHKILEDSVHSYSKEKLLSHPELLQLDNKDKSIILSYLNNISQSDDFTSLILDKKNILKAELYLMGRVTNNGGINSKRIDLMVIKPNNEIVIIDYKSDINVPKEPSHVSKEYIKQLCGYKNMIKKLNPKKKIITKIMWLKEGMLMDI